MTTMQTETSLAETLSFILSKADDADIDRIYSAIRQRQQGLRAIKAAAVSVGAEVALTGLSPKYLNGLTGTVKSINGQRCDVELDETSTMTLRFSGRKFFVPQGVTNYVVNGVPLSCAGVK